MKIDVVELVTLVDQLDRGPEGGEPIERKLHRWIITTDTGYRAEIIECPCALWRHGGSSHYPAPEGAPISAYGPLKYAIYVPMTNCLCGKRSNECTRGTKAQRDLFCHGWHRPRVDAMLAALERTVSVKGRADMRARLRGPARRPLWSPDDFGTGHGMNCKTVDCHICHLGSA